MWIEHPSSFLARGAPVLRPARVLLALVTLWGVASAAERLPTFPKETPYAEARRSLIALGWQPVTLPDADKCDADDPRCKGRPEMLACSGTGLARCIFTWKRKDTLIEVTTFGEQEAIVERLRCRAGCR
jgi:hypothetical protein